MTDSATPELKFTFPKSERLHSKKLIEELFTEGSYFYLYPFRISFLPKKDEISSSQVLFSVSKKKFKSAVKRNRIKRLMKEAYRLNKHQIINSHYLIGFVYTSDEMPEFKFINKRIEKALKKLSEMSI